MLIGVDGGAAGYVLCGVTGYDVGVVGYGPGVPDASLSFGRIPLPGVNVAPLDEPGVLYGDVGVALCGNSFGP